MKKIMKFAIMLALALTVCATVFNALAGADVRYVNCSKVKVYEEQDTGSSVIKKIKGGSKVLIEVDMGSWVGILVENTKHGGQTLGYIQSKYLSHDVPPDYCKHDWTKWTVIKEPTCTEKGKRTRNCTICGKVVTEGIKAKGHDWSKWKVTKEATCYTLGQRVRTCSVCGKKQTDEYYDDHTFGEWELIKAPTCTEKGERQHTCLVCGVTKTQELDTLPHSYAHQIITEATDHSSGVRAKICQVCGKNGGEESFDPEGTLRRKDRSEAVYHMQQLLVEQGYLNAHGADGVFGGGTEKALKKYQQDRGLNPDGIGWPQTLKDLEHDFGPWQIVKPLTRSESGERMRVCQGCGFEQHETLEAGTVLQKGSRGESVRALQQIIKQVGYDAGGLDGIYGKKLDKAMASFAQANGLVVEAGKVRPIDMDAVMNAWLNTIPEDSWKGEGDVNSPVSLALNVEPAGEGDNSGIITYNWSITNLGSQKATFTTLLLTFGDPDFRRDDLVMVLDGIELKPGAGSSAYGSFNVDAEWGEGNLNFAALAISEPDGAKWLSNTVTFDNPANPA